MGEWVYGGLRGEQPAGGSATQSAGLASDRQRIFTALACIGADVASKATDKSLSTEKTGALLCTTTNLGATRSRHTDGSTYCTLCVWNSPKSHRCPRHSHP